MSELSEALIDRPRYTPTDEKQQYIYEGLILGVCPNCRQIVSAMEKHQQLVVPNYRFLVHVRCA